MNIDIHELNKYRHARINDCSHESHSRIDSTSPQVEPSMRPAATHVHEHAWFQYAETQCVCFWCLSSWLRWLIVTFRRKLSLRPHTVHFFSGCLRLWYWDDRYEFVIFKWRLSSRPHTLRLFIVSGLMILRWMTWVRDIVIFRWRLRSRPHTMLFFFVSKFVILRWRIWVRDFVIFRWKLTNIFYIMITMQSTSTRHELFSTTRTEFVTHIANSVVFYIHISLTIQSSSTCPTESFQKHEPSSWHTSQTQ